MAQPLRSIGAITLFVDDVARSKAWYQRVFDLAVLFEDAESIAFKMDNTIINLLVAEAAHSLIAPAAVADGAAGARSQFTVWVDDADAVCADLRERGVALINGPDDRPWGQRTACFADPDGHVWEIAQAIP